jgi:hypothetical protein
MSAFFRSWFDLLFPLILLLSEGVDLLYWGWGPFQAQEGLTG